jgi:O-antigen/teichoic acid export membrane protein
MVLTVGLGLVTTPILLRLLGVEVFGVYKILGDWMANLAILELGLGGAVVTVLIPTVHAGDRRATASALKEGFRAYSFMLVPMFVCAVVAVAFVPMFVEHRGISRSEMIAAGLILTVPLMFLPISIFRSLLDVRQRTYLVNLLLIFQSVLTVLLQLSAAFLGFGLLGVCAAATIAQVPFIAVVTWHGLRSYPRFWRSEPQREMRKRIWSVNWSVFIYKTMGRIGLHSDNLVVGQALGPAAVASFFLTQRGAVIAQNQLQGIGQVAWAGLMELHHRGEARKFELRLVELTSLVSGLGIAVLGSIAVFNHSFVNLWTGTTIYAGSAVNWIVGINAWMWSIFSLWGWPVDASGNTRSMVPFSVAGGLLNLAVSIAATRIVGISGPLLGTLVAFVAVYSWAIPGILKRVFDIDPSRLVWAALKPLAWGVPYISLAWWTFSQRPVNSWPSLVVDSGLTALGSLALWWFLSLNGTDRQAWSARLQVLRIRQTAAVAEL